MPSKKENRTHAFKKNRYKLGKHDPLGVNFGTYFLDGVQAVSNDLSSENKGVLELLWDCKEQFALSHDSFGAYAFPIQGGTSETTENRFFDHLEIEREFLIDLEGAKDLLSMSSSEIEQLYPFKHQEKVKKHHYTRQEIALKYQKLIDLLNTWLDSLPSTLKDWLLTFKKMSDFPNLGWTSMQLLFAMHAANTLRNWLIDEVKPEPLHWIGIEAPDEIKFGVTAFLSYPEGFDSELFEYEIEAFQFNHTLETYNEWVRKDFDAKFSAYIDTLREYIEENTVSFDLKKDRFIHSQIEQPRKSKRKREDIFYWYALYMFHDFNYTKMSHYWEQKMNKSINQRDDFSSVQDYSEHSFLLSEQKIKSVRSRVEQLLPTS